MLMCAVAYALVRGLVRTMRGDLAVRPVESRVTVASAVPAEAATVAFARLLNRAVVPLVPVRVAHEKCDTRVAQM